MLICYNFTKTEIGKGVGCEYYLWEKSWVYKKKKIIWIIQGDDFAKTQEILGQDMHEGLKIMEDEYK